MNIENLFNKALAKGFSDVQAYLVDKHDLSIEVFDGELEKYEIADSSTLTIKAIYNNKMATHVTEIMSDTTVDDIIEKMLENAKVVDSLDEAIIYPGDKEYAKLDGLYNPEMANADVKKKIEIVKRLDKGIHEADSRVKIVESMYSESSRRVLLQNTKGLKLEDVANGAMLGSEVIVKDDKDQRTAFDVLISNDLEDFQVEELKDTIVRHAVMALGAKPVKSGEYKLVFDRNAVATILYAFQGVFSADNVHKGMSLLKGKLNTQIGSGLVTICDDPFMKKSSQSRSFDDEGVATKYKELIKEGVLTTYLHNLVSARKDGVESTGNGFGGSVSAVNLKMLPGDATKDELIQSVENGLLITDLQGAHAGANPISGDFSLQASGFRINDGKLGDPVALVTVASNFIDFLKNIEGVASDLKTNYYGITCPSVCVKPMTVSGL